MWFGLLLGVVNMLTFPSSGVFAFRLPLSQELAGLGIAIDSTGVVLFGFRHVGFSRFCGLVAHVA